MLFTKSKAGALPNPRTQHVHAIWSKPKQRTNTKKALKGLFSFRTEHAPHACCNNTRLSFVLTPPL